MLLVGMIELFFELRHGDIIYSFQLLRRATRAGVRAKDTNVIHSSMYKITIIMVDTVVKRTARAKQ